MTEEEKKEYSLNSIEEIKDKGFQQQSLSNKYVEEKLFEEATNWDNAEEEGDWSSSKTTWMKETNQDLNELLKLRDQLTISTNLQKNNVRETLNSQSKKEETIESTIQSPNKIMKQESTKENMFQCYYLYIEEEPKEKEIQLSKKEEQLLMQYEAEESKFNDEEWEEEYESSKEKVFLKFQKRISRSPEQCLRYNH